MIYNNTDVASRHSFTRAQVAKPHQATHAMTHRPAVTAERPDGPTPVLSLSHECRNTCHTNANTKCTCVHTHFQLRSVPIGRRGISQACSPSSAEALPSTLSHAAWRPNTLHTRDEIRDVNVQHSHVTQRPSQSTRYDSQILI